MIDDPELLTPEVAEEQRRGGVVRKFHLSLRYVAIFPEVVEILQRTEPWLFEGRRFPVWMLPEGMYLG